MSINKCTIAYIIYLLFTCCFTGLQGQQLPLFTQYREAIGIINPAAMSSSFFSDEERYSLFAGISARTQWVGRKGTPQTQFIHAEKVLEGDNVYVLYGGYIINDQVDRIGTTGIYGRASVIITSDPSESGLAVGLSGGMVHYRVRLEGAIVRDPDDELALTNQSRTRPDLGAGIYAWRSLGRKNNLLFGGISIPQVLGLDVSFRDGEDNTFSIERVRHFYTTLGTRLYLGGEYNYIEPVAWLKYVPHAPIHADMGIRYRFFEYLWIGGGYSTNGNSHVEIGTIIPDSYGERDIRIGYGFDGNFSGNVAYYGNSHEINISIGLAK